MQSLKCAFSMINTDERISIILLFGIFPSAFRFMRHDTRPRYFCAWWPGDDVVDWVGVSLFQQAYAARGAGNGSTIESWMKRIPFSRQNEFRREGY